MNLGRGLLGMYSGGAGERRVLPSGEQSTRIAAEEIVAGMAALKRGLYEALILP